MIKFLKTLARLFKKLFSEFGTVEGKQRRDEYDRQQKLKELDDEIRKLREDMEDAVLSGDNDDFNRLHGMLESKLRERADL